MKECNKETVAIPPIVDRSSAVNPPDSMFRVDLREFGFDFTDLGGLLYAFFGKWCGVCWRVFVQGCKVILT
ncbi:hypothetical protein Hanom_Chr04g00315531 [Helianthus anomalus]